MSKSEDIFKAQSHFNKWLTELNADEKRLVLNMMDERAAGAEYALSLVENKWVSVETELPEKHADYPNSEWCAKDVLVLTLYSYKIGRTKNGEWVDMQNNLIENVTHWMPLPSPPSQ